MIDSKVIEFKGMPLFVKARFIPPFVMQGAIMDYACFFYISKGAMASYDARGLHQIGEREAIMKSCGNYVQNYLSTKNSEECEAIAVYLYPELLKEVYKDEVPSFLRTEQAPPKRFIGNELIEQYMTNLSVYFEQPDSIDEELGILKIKELMMILLKSESHQDIRKLLSEIFEPVNVKFKEAVNNNIFSTLSMEQLAFICNMSLSTFKREFKKSFDETPAKYIKRKRLEHAASLLLCSDQSITSVAFESGFSDVSTFSAVFADKFQLSPTQYRLSQTRNSLAI